MKERRYDVDWLRVITMLLVFLFHCSRFFDNEGWHLKVPVSQQSEILPILRTFFVAAWFMEMFFLVAGFATRYSLRHRTAGQYLLERVKRLLVPLYTVGLFILVVPQAYFEGVTNWGVTKTFWQWLPSYYAGIPGSLFGTPRWADPISLLPYTFAGHLWFIQMLFIVAVLTLPLILYFESAGGQRLVGRLAGWFDRPGGIFWFLIPLVITQVALNWLPKTTDRTWGDFCRYALFFVMGYLIACDERFTNSIKRHAWLCLGLWIGLFLGVGGILTLGLGYDPSPGHGFSLEYLIWQVAGQTVVWSAAVFIFNLAARYLTFTNRFLVYANEAVLPFFLFHQTIILIVGWFVLPWNIANLVKYFIIAGISFPVILLLYEVFVRHIHFMRFLFGMAPQKK